MYTYTLVPQGDMAAVWQICQLIAAMEPQKKKNVILLD